MHSQQNNGQRSSSGQRNARRKERYPLELWEMVFGMRLP